MRDTMVSACSGFGYGAYLFPPFRASIMGLLGSVVCVWMSHQWVGRIIAMVAAML